MNKRLKLCTTLLLSFLVTLNCFSESLEFKRPQTEEELKTWIVGTEWKTREMRKGKRISIIRRFYPQGIMKIQSGVSRWAEGEPINDFKYKIVTHKSIEYGPLRWGRGNHLLSSSRRGPSSG